MVSVRGGALVHNARDGVFDLWTSDLTLKSSDFVSQVAGFDLMVNVVGPIDLFVGGDWSVVDLQSRSSRGITEATAQQTRIESFPALYAGLHARIYDPGRSADAWSVGVQAGAGVFRYRIEQSGVFTDFDEPLLQVEGQYVSTDEAPVAVAGLSIDRRLTSSFALLVDARYRYAVADARGDFADFDEVDLSGFQLSAGLRVVFGG